MKYSLSYRNLCFEGIIPLLSSLITWIVVIKWILNYHWTNPIWENILFLFIIMDMIFLLSIYPIGVLVKCLLYDYGTLLEYEDSNEKIYYERKDIKVDFQLSDIKSLVRIRPKLKSAPGFIYEIELYSGYVITVTDLLPVMQQVEKQYGRQIETCYECVLFCQFYNVKPENDSEKNITFS